MSGNARAVVFSSAPVAAAVLLLCHGLAAHAQVESAADAPIVQAVPDLPTVNVIAVTPLPGLDVPIDQIPSNVQTATGAEMERFHSLDLSNFLARAIGGVTVNETQGNPFQPDINYRGFTACRAAATP